MVMKTKKCLVPEKPFEHEESQKLFTIFLIKAMMNT